MILMKRLNVPDILLEVYSFLIFLLHIDFLIFKFTAGQAFINALSKSLVLGWGRLASPGRTTDKG